MLLGGALEYVCSFLQEIFFDSISWDYSNLFLNLNGRTSIQYCIYWGIIGVFFLKIVYPGIQKMDTILDNKKMIICSYILMIFVIFDVVISCMATTRQTQRQQQIPPQNKVDEFLDRTYPDEFLDRIYNNKKSINEI